MKKTHWILKLFCLPWALTISLPLALILKVLGLAHHFHMDEGVLKGEFTPRASKHWRYSTTVGLLMLFDADLRGTYVRNLIGHHEAVHVRQYEDHSVVAFFVGLIVGLVTGNWWLGAGIWWSSLLWVLPNYLTSCFRWGFTQDVSYRDAEHERSAYAQTDKPGYASWSEDREQQRNARAGVPL